ncbi:MAG: glycosyltransferase [Terriglobales bacterium]
MERERLGNVRLAGLLQAEELKQHYQLADIFLFPSTWEGSPMVLLEAAACGLPVIARNNYQPETVVDGETGYLCASDDELFGRLGEMIVSPEQRRKFGEAGCRHSEKFDWGPIARRWQEVFLDLMSRKTAARAA